MIAKNILQISEQVKAILQVESCMDRLIYYPYNDVVMAVPGNNQSNGRHTRTARVVPDMSRKDIPYAGADDPLRQFDIYYSESSLTTNPPPLICFVHGGAWRSGDKREHELLAQRLLAATNYPVAVPNYRLTPQSNKDPSFRHPMHVRDLVDFLLFVMGWENPPCSYDPSRVILIGHSCSAHMISTLFFISTENGSGSIPCPQILDSIKGVILSEGIYDISALLQSFPAYRDWFIEPTFGSDSYSNFSIVNATLHSRVDFPWLLIHSEGDTLIDVYQTTEMHNHLKNSQAGVMISLFDVVGEHDAILETEEYVNVVKKFLLPKSSI